MLGKLFDSYSSLTKSTMKRTNSQLSVKRHNTTVSTSSQYHMTPLCLTTSNPKRVKTLTASSHEIFGNLGGIGCLKCCKYWRFSFRQGKFLQIKFGCFLYVS